MKNKLKNKPYLLPYMALLTISLGIFAGCSSNVPTHDDVSTADIPSTDASFNEEASDSHSQADASPNEDASDSHSQADASPNEDASSSHSQADAPFNNEVSGSELSADNGNSALPAAAPEDTGEKNTMTLTIMKGGEAEEKQATLVAGNGFSLYLPDGEWQEDGADKWYATANKDVRIWITHFDSNYSMEQILDGYVPEGEELMKQENGLIYKLELHETENGTWCVFYCYPPEAEEGWGREIPVITDTFSITAP